LQARQGKNFHQTLAFLGDPKGFFTFAQWVWAPKLVLFKCIWSKMLNSIKILAPFFKDFRAKAYTVQYGF
jgi:hypothetical protein